MIEETIIVNQLRCNACGDEPFSQSVHDFKSCKCGAVAVDGGQEYLRRVGDFRNSTEMSYSLPTEAVNAAKKAVIWANETGRNEYGTALAVIRALHDAGVLIVK